MMNRDKTTCLNNHPFDLANTRITPTEVVCVALADGRHGDVNIHLINSFHPYCESWQRPIERQPNAVSFTYVGSTGLRVSNMTSFVSSRTEHVPYAFALIENLESITTTKLEKYVVSSVIHVTRLLAQ